MSINRADSIDELVEAGRYGEAAERAIARGELVRAAELYERIWDFAAAARCRLDGGDLAGALRAAIEARDEALIVRADDALSAGGEEGQRAALEIFVERRRFARAGRLAEELGELERAADCYQRAHLDLDAARVLSALGRDRDAGRLLERAVEIGEPGEERARAQLQLGHLLARRLQHESAVRCLQEAAREDATRAEARRALIVELAALGLRDAARDVLLTARADDPSLPVDLDELLRGEREPPPERSADRQLVAGRYHLEELLGSGGSGRVHRAHDEVTGREVAIKLVASAPRRGDPAYERFAREAGIAQSMRHPNLVEVFDVSTEQGYLVMELMTGGSLEARLDGPRPGAWVRRLALDLLGGLELAHQRGVIHRDVKPANVFFDARGTAKLGDFGVAHLLDLGQTQTGGLIGTLAYMAPEQITGAPLTIAADLYSLGVTLYQALTGRLPLQGPDFVAQHLGSVPPPASAFAELAPGWDPILTRLLEKDPDQRFESVDAVRRAVAAIDLGARHRPLVLPRHGVPLPTSASSTSIPAQTGDPEHEDTPRYQFETPIAQSERSRLARAVDTALDRSVVIERFAAPLDDAREQRLFALARGGGPFLQRALSYDRAAGVAIFEAPAGLPIGELDEPLPPRTAVRLLGRLARALAPLHEHDRCHGRLEPSTVLLDDDANPTVLASGLGPMPEDASPEGDVAASIDLVAAAIGARSGAGALIDALAPGLPPGRREALRALPRRTGEELHAFAAALELDVLARLLGAPAA